MGSEAIWDFVIAAPPAVLLRSITARSTAHPRVLLLEAGVRGDGKSSHVDRVSKNFHYRSCERGSSLLHYAGEQFVV
ncbi:uncharacterized protein P174DRAFT_452642 [Aspergillus novofumigatus IBT 16806]|uniref:Uncharacterized protein n=1 Tax=Aspergillus novofumigatus (strain IBT 16806) TaxID=1392255 RepID=A0A2I1C733_ASPN1|nr:uncharacterized protein P174DRAFT_452642 [Aspergillus novofumigatus IBT 16806]PKX93452.1 hypothetical protein P174DRAFT_452642 [Aspergillus novofumigatus IBT 16806]